MDKTVFENATNHLRALQFEPEIDQARERIAQSRQAINELGVLARDQSSIVIRWRVAADLLNPNS
jgi:hypothetical protein